MFRIARADWSQGRRFQALSMEDLRKKYSWWPSGSSNSGEPIALIDMGAMSGAGDSARGVVKSTNL